MIYTLPNIIREVMFGTGQNVNAPSMDRAVLSMKVDAAQDKITDVILEVRPSILSAYYDLTLTGSEEYPLADYIQWNYEAIVKVQDVTNADQPAKTTPFNWGDSDAWTSSDIFPDYTGWSIRDGSLVLPAKPTTGTLRIWYTRRPVGLFYGTAEGGTDTTVVFPATPTVGELIPEDGYYVGMLVCCTNQLRRITGYTASTRTATVDSAWTTNPTSSTEVSLVSPLPRRYHPLIADLAVRRIKVAVDDDDSLVLRALNEDMALMNARLAKSQVQTPEYVRKVR